MLVCVGKGEMMETRTLRAESNNTALIRLSSVEYLVPRALHEFEEVPKKKGNIPSPESSF